MRQDEQRARHDAGGAQAGHGAANDERDGVLGDAADEAAELEEADGDEIDPFDAEVDVELAKEELQGGGSQEVGLNIFSLAY